MHRNPVILTRPQQQQQQQQQSKPPQTQRDKRTTAASGNNAADDMPYSQWTKLTASNGLVYLAHPQTGESKWLWSRHWDPTSGKDYLVNTITGERLWVTKANEHLCPLRAPIPSDSQSNTPSSATETQQQTQNQGPVYPKKPTANNKSAIPATAFNVTSSNNNTQTQPGPSSVPTASASTIAAAAAHGTGRGQFGKVSSFAKPDQFTSASEAATRNTLGLPSSATTSSPTSQMAKDFALAPGEVLMTSPGSGQPYALNTQTNTRRWLTSPSAPINSQSRSNPGHYHINDPIAANTYPNINPSARLSGNNVHKANVHTNFHQNTNNNPSVRNVDPSSNHSSGAWRSGQQRQTSGATNPLGSQRMTPSSLPQGTQHPTSSEHSTSSGPVRRAGVQPSANAGNASKPTNLPSSSSKEAEGGQQAVSAKVLVLEELLQEVTRMTNGGKYDLSKLEQAVNARMGSRGANGNTKTSTVTKGTDAEDDVDQRLLQLAELLTQSMLKVDAVDSDGSAIVRSKRKLVVNRLLTLADKVEALRNALKGSR